MAVFYQLAASLVVLAAMLMIRSSPGEPRPPG